MTAIQRVSVLSLKNIPWNNGREIGINGGRTLYFNGLPRTLGEANGTLNVTNIPDSSWQWHQTFGFDSAEGSNGEMVSLPKASRSVEIAMDISRSKGQFLKLEVIGEGPNHNEELWVRHPDSSLVVFSHDASSGLWTAPLSDRVGDNISKVQFCGQLVVLDMDLKHIDLVA